MSDQVVLNLEERFLPTSVVQTGFHFGVDIVEVATCSAGGRFRSKDAASVERRVTLFFKTCPNIAVNAPLH